MAACQWDAAASGAAWTSSPQTPPQHLSSPVAARNGTAGICCYAALQGLAALWVPEAEDCCQLCARGAVVGAAAQCCCKLKPLVRS